MAEETISRGDKVQVLCSTCLDDGVFIDSPEDRKKPLWIKAGHTPPLEAIGTAVIGMKIGDSKTITVTPDKAFGIYDTSKILEIPRTNLPEGIQTGERVIINLEGEEFMAVVKDLDSIHGFLDTNHPLAGRTLTISVEIVSIQK